jgi:hypothetical protein
MPPVPTTMENGIMPQVSTKFIENSCLSTKEEFLYNSKEQKHHRKSNYLGLRMILLNKVLERRNELSI